MMAQFLDIKSGYPDALLFYRMGDFYELFFDDAVAAAEALDIALTKRGKHLGEDIPMCGVPVHSAEGYLLTLIRKGFRVAVCEQIEDPTEAKKRGSKSVVKRAVQRLVTPGTLTEDSLLEPRRSNYLAAYAEVRGEAALAWTDMSTGEFRVITTGPDRLLSDLARLGPSEILVPDRLYADLDPMLDETGLAVTTLASSEFDSELGTRRICDQFGVAATDAFGSFNRADLGALGSVLGYLAATQKGQLPLLKAPSQDRPNGFMQIDAATRANLELTRSLGGDRKGSLLSVIDKTATAAGARLLERRLSSPSRDLDVITRRQADVTAFFDRYETTESIRSCLRKTPDLERALSRLALERGGPRDLAAVRSALHQAAEIGQILSRDVPKAMVQTRDALAIDPSLADTLARALVEEPPLRLSDGGFIAEGFDSSLDDARELRDHGRGTIAGLQADYAEVADIPSLKIKHNNVLGYFIETTATHADKMLSPPLSERFIHRQTTANAVRFTTKDLSDLESRILSAGEEAARIEGRLYSGLSGQILVMADDIRRVADALAEVDVAAGFASLSKSESWVLPKLDNSRAFVITGGRHPVVERALATSQTSRFIANDCNLTAEEGASIRLLTGPNMAGKSTYLRQNALIAILAQIGSYVPADAAHIGLVSQVFSRVGASDDLARGRSTFMVEMVETAAILNQADETALVILDEIGRGTATYDGLSIAWATLEHLHEVNKCRAMFATHYHELTALADQLVGVGNATVAVKEWDGDVIFLHEVRDGAADRSYGVQVAKLAGLPPAVVTRAREVLDKLEKSDRSGAGQASLIDDLPLFSATQTAPEVPKSNPALDRLAALEPDALTPRDALNLIYELKGLTQD